MRLLVVLALLLAGCAVNTKTNWLSSNTAIVSGDGTWRHSGGELTKAMLLRAAQEGQARGFQYFKVMDTQDRSAAVSSSNAGPLLWVPTGAGGGMLVPTGGTSSTRMAPAGDATIRYYREGEDRPSGVWSCAEVLAAR